jgi:putative transposase
VFYESSDYSAYLDWLGESTEKYHCSIHAYVLMTNHVHILATPVDKVGISRMMQYVGRKYVPYINYNYGTSGSIWEGRYKASLVQEDTYLLSCMRYIELNPVRANMVKYPAAYRWSSYRANAQGKPDKLLNAHPMYKALGSTDMKRREAYISLFATQIDKNEVKEIRDCWQTGTPLGNDHFKHKIEEKLKCKVGQTRRGRPQRPRKGL